MYFVNPERAKEFLELISPFYDTFHGNANHENLSAEEKKIETNKKEENASAALDENHEYPSILGKDEDEEINESSQNEMGEESDEDDEGGSTQNWPYQLVWNEEKLADVKLRFLGPGNR